MSINVIEYRLNNIPFFKEEQEFLLKCLFQCFCIVLVVDSTSIVSFQIIEKFLQIFNAKNFPYLNIIVIINKIDLISERIVKLDTWKNTNMTKSNVYFFETTLFSNHNIPNIINLIEFCLFKKEVIYPIQIIEEVKVKPSAKNHTIRILILGHQGSGKTGFFVRLSNNPFLGYNLKMSSCFPDHSIDVKLFDKIYKAVIYDTPGKIKFRNLKRILPNKYINGIIFLFDSTNITNYCNLDELIENAVNFFGQGIRKNQIYYLVCNKIDSPERMVYESEARKFAEEKSMRYFEVSARLNINIFEVLSEMLYDCIQKIEKIEDVSKKSCILF